MCPDSNYPSFGLSPIPFNTTVDYDGVNNSLKLGHDAYDIYVNDMYVGKKTLVSQNESIQDVDAFLHNKGFTAFTSSLEGDHYRIQAEENSAEIASNIEVLLGNR